MPSTLHQILHAFSNQPPSHIKKREYKFLDCPELGSGGYSTVRLARWKTHEDVEVAVKIVRKNAIADKTKYLRVLHAGWGERLERRHEHICPLLDWFESSNHYYLTFPLLSGGELLQKILDKGRFSEEEARKALVVILEVVSYIHHQGIIHRDLKAENFLYTSKDSAIDDFQLIDFGISKILTPDANSDIEDPKIETEVSGTPGFAAPEIFLKTGYGKNSDCFSIGVIAYALLCGSSPWNARDPWGIVQETINMKEVNFSGRKFTGVSQDAKDFIRYLMLPDPNLRPSSQQARNHPWLTTPRMHQSRPPTRPPSPNFEHGDGPARYPPEDPHHPMEVLRRQDTLKPSEIDMNALERKLTKEMER